MTQLAGLLEELGLVTKTIQGEGNYLGLKGELLAKYLAQLREKEGLIRERDRLLAETERALEAPLRPAPTGPAPAFDRESLAAVYQHMRDFEAVPLESMKALRALASLAYKGADAVAQDEKAFKQLLRLLRMHSSEAAVQLAAMKCICHLAFSKELAVGFLARPDVLATLITVRGLEGDSNAAQEASKLAGEALARIAIADAEIVSETGPAQPPEVAASAVTTYFRAEASSLAEAFKKDVSSRKGVEEVTLGLLEVSELVTADFFAERFVAAAPTFEPSSAEGAAAALGWLCLLARQLSAEGSYSSVLAEALVKHGAALAITSLMDLHPTNWDVLGKAPECLLLLVTTTFIDGQWAVHRVEGVPRVLKLLRALPQAEELQLHGLKLLLATKDWHMDIKAELKLNAEEQLQMIKKVFEVHPDSEKAVLAAFKLVHGVIMVVGSERLHEDGMNQIIDKAVHRHKSNKEIEEAGTKLKEAMLLFLVWPFGG
eukprot:CAMPEP_0197631400 /NCGR_PEP_ID=MMETSP1338-20131121/8565_1 /TAXON_ID=43686 ORGANISM="Pelagodinium beii, Strain RCC1491" /NCGR_SAMPLE_ID=MMETSP1338 /ASSEMBLY_ACC=CAM_ASM_000754 /LENGTH=487 /DNA_ID=CAMNT_0043202831 /DNA_START=46 /DNA_END=1509 /DNA_ORIENTATION=-